MLNVPNEKIKVIKKHGPFVYGMKKTRDARKAKKRCVQGCDMYIVRVKKDADEWAMSKPCKDCWEVMHTLGIRKVYYSTGIGTWMCEKVASMETTHRSSGVLALQAYKHQERVEKKRQRS
jgi:deoxycytidylate deaminase